MLPLLLSIFLAPAANDPPLAPVITEPTSAGQVLNPADVHMEVAGFSDPNPGDTHLCSDWEIRTVPRNERVWLAACVDGPEAIHAHLGDGVFEGSLAGAGALLENASYELRTRHRDSSGDPASEWGPWSTIGFQTGPAQTWFALAIDDVADLPAPAWRATDGTPVDLPGGAAPALLSIESGVGELLYELTGVDGGPDAVQNPPALATHEPVRVRVIAGSVGLSLQETVIELYEHGCESHAMFLPVIDIGPGSEAQYWISSEGLPFTAFPWQTDPVFSTPALLPDPPWVAEQAGFVVETVAAGFQLAVDIAFVPTPGPDPDDLLFYVSELYGTIKTVARDGTVGVYASGLLDFSPTGFFPGSGEQGLTGLAVDPVTGDVLAAMLYDGGLFAGHFPKVVRFASADGGWTAASQTTILDFPGETQGQSHQISNLAIAPDGTLLVHMGDGFDSGTAQDPLSYRGKILRANLDGSAPADNPFYDAGDGIDARDYTWALGVRNPFGGDLRAADGLLYEVENGPSTDRMVRVTAGMNVGWDGSSASMLLNALHVWSPAKAPVDLAFADAAAFAAGGFPAEKVGHAFVSLSGATYATGPQTGAKRIVEFTLDASGAVVGGPLELAHYAGTGKSSIAGLAFGPDGLYFTTLYPDAPAAGPTGVGASVLRVRYEGIADCNGNGVPDACDIAGGASLDADGDGVPDECQPLVTPYGCGVNPAASLVLLSGLPAVGTTFVLGVDNPLGTQAPGAQPFVGLSLAPDAAFPCGKLLPGYGMAAADAAGELLISFAAPPPFAIVAGPPWAGPGTPAPIPLTVPSDPGLAGISVFAQGLLEDPLAPFGVDRALTGAFELRMGL